MEAAEAELKQRRLLRTVGRTPAHTSLLMLNAPVRSGAARVRKQDETDNMLYVGLVLLILVNVCFFVGWSFLHRNDKANVARRVSQSAHVRAGMRDDPTERCKMTNDEYTVRNGRAALRPNRRSGHVHRCQGMSDPVAAKVVGNVHAQCPFLAAVYDSGGKAEMDTTIDIVSRSIAVTGRWEPRESAIIEDLPTDSLVVDIGANVGWHTLLALSLGHSVIAFEPMGANIKLLKHSLCLNPGLSDNLELHEVALTDMINCTIGSAGDNKGDGILLCGSEQAQAFQNAVAVGSAQGGGQVGQRQRVNTGRMDYYLHVGPQIDLLKIDVEGHELSVVRSGATIFERKRGHVPPAYIISEFSPGSMERLGYNPVEYLEFFANRDYRIAYRDEPKSALDSWTAASGSPKAHHVVERSQFVEFARQIWDASITIEMSLLDAPH